MEVSSKKNIIVAIAADLSKPEEIERVMEEVSFRLKENTSKIRVLTITADLSQPEDIERVMATTLNEFNGQLDVLVNNASILGATPMPYLLDYPLEDFRNVINTNLIAPFLLIKKTTPFTFTLPEELCAKEPPERRGIARDRVRLMVIDRTTEEVFHSRFDRLAQFLRPGDLLVFNSSRTLPASLKGCQTPIGPCIRVRLAERLPDRSWLALLTCQQGDPFACGLHEGMQIQFDRGLRVTVICGDRNIPRLWKLHFSKSGTELLDLFYRIGEPIRYEYVSAYIYSKNLEKFLLLSKCYKLLQFLKKKEGKEIFVSAII